MNTERIDDIEHVKAFMMLLIGCGIETSQVALEGYKLALEKCSDRVAAAAVTEDAVHALGISPMHLRSYATKSSRSY